MLLLCLLGFIINIFTLYIIIFINVLSKHTRGKNLSTKTIELDTLPLLVNSDRTEVYLKFLYLSMDNVEISLFSYECFTLLWDL